MSQLVNFVSWSVLVLILLFTTFGPSLILFIINCLLISFVAIYYSLIQYQKSLQPHKNSSIKLNLISSNQLNQSLKKSKLYLKKVYKCESLTGNVMIDEQLKDIIDLVFRDIIIPWYSHVSSNTHFLNDLRLFIYLVIRNLASR